MNANYSQGCRTARFALVALAVLACQPAWALVHAEHSLRYTGWLGWKPVTVEVTLRKRPGNLYEYREWIAPRWWAAVLGDPRAITTMLEVVGSDFRPVSHEPADGNTRDLRTLDDDVFDLLAVRLEARAAIAAGRDRAVYRVWQEDGTIESWQLELTGTDTVETPDGSYQCLTFRLGNDDHWIEGWSAPLLVFHFVRLEFWEDGDRTGALDLELKELWE